MSMMTQLFGDFSINQVVIWGHKLHSHTHSYIHYGFCRAFSHLGYRTLWLDNNDDLSGIDFAHSLFITEHQVDQKMPLRDDCYYFVHCSDSTIISKRLNIL